MLYGGGTINNYNYISGGRQGIYTYYRPATVINKGLISAYGTNGVGIILSAGGRVTNDGTVFGDVGGVKIQGANATLANYGTIKNRASAPFGVSLDGFLGNFVTNTGYIEDNVIETGAPGTLVNSGTIVGSVSIGHSGIVTNGVSGSTAAQIDGFFTNITGGVGTITNYGTISGFFEGVDLSAGGVVNNAQPGAVITTGNSGQEGIFIGGYTQGTVTNLGTVEVNGSVGVAVNLATAGGTLTNGSTSVSTALIEFATQTEGFGVYSSPVASITNYGTISAGTGIFLKSGGNAFNTGSAARIAAEFTGINLPGASPTDTVVNTGTVDADGLANNKYISSYGVRIETGSIVNGGTAATQALIIADPTGLDTPTAPVPMHSFGVEFVAGGNLTNYGTVAGARGGVDISAGVVTNGPGDVRSALIEGRYYGVHTAGTAAQSVAVTNFGTISAIGTAGIGIDFDDTADNTVSNSGTIDGGGGTAIAFGAGDDRLIVEPGAVFDGVVDGGGGGNEIDFHTAGKISLAPEFIGFARVRLIVAASLALKPARIWRGSPAKPLPSSTALPATPSAPPPLTATEEATVKGGAGNDVFVGGAGKDIFTGGAGADTFDFSAAALGAGDRVLGGSGADELVMTTPGTVTATGVSGVETWRLANGKPNDLRLTTGNFTGTTGAAITVIDGNAGDTVNAIALSASDRTTVIGGSGNDVFIGSAGIGLLQWPCGQRHVQIFGREPVGERCRQRRRRQRYPLSDERRHGGGGRGQPGRDLAARQWRRQQADPDSGQLCRSDGGDDHRGGRQYRQHGRRAPGWRARRDNHGRRRRRGRVHRRPRHRHFRIFLRVPRGDGHRAGRRRQQSAADDERRQDRGNGGQRGRDLPARQWRRQYPLSDQCQLCRDVGRDDHGDRWKKRQHGKRSRRIGIRSRPFWWVVRGPTS